jgi:hypothetical protein
VQTDCACIFADFLPIEVECEDGAAEVDPRAHIHWTNKIVWTWPPDGHFLFDEEGEVAEIIEIPNP